MEKGVPAVAEVKEIIEEIDESADNGAVDVQKILEEYEGGAATRSTGSAFWDRIINAIAIGMSLFHLYTAFFGELATLIQRAIHLGFAMFLLYIFVAPKKGMEKIGWYDYVFAILGAASSFYIVLFYEDFIARAGSPNMWDIIMGVILIALVLEGARRVGGIWFFLIIAFFLAYTFIPGMPGILGHRAYQFKTVISHMYSVEGVLTTPIGVSATFVFMFILFGAFLEFTGVGNLFIELALALAGWSVGGPAKVAVIASGLMGTISGSSVANVVGTGSFTIPLMKSIGYPPYFAGAVEAAASTGGQIMPPVMGAAAFIMAEFLELPYRDIMIAAILPAVLYYLAVGIMVHYEAKRLGLKGISRENLPSAVKILKEKWILFLPIIGIVYMLLKNYTPTFTAAWGIVIGVVAIYLVKEERKYMKAIFGILMVLVLASIYIYGFPQVEGKVHLFGMVIQRTTLTKWLNIFGFFTIFIAPLLSSAPTKEFKRLLDTLAGGAKSAVGVAMACAGAGIVIGSVTLTGLGGKLTTSLINIASSWAAGLHSIMPFISQDGMKLFLTMFFTMIASIILGMGLPTTAKYVVLATMAVPAMVNLGVFPLAAHLFVLYFGVIADLTPPVALAAYAGAGIAGADPNKTGWTAVKLALAGFILPFMFAYNPYLLFIDPDKTTMSVGGKLIPYSQYLQQLRGGTKFFAVKIGEITFLADPIKILQVFITGLLGAYALGLAAEGYESDYLKWWERTLFVIAAFLMIDPTFITDIVGITLLAVTLFIHKARVKRLKAA